MVAIAATEQDVWPPRVQIAVTGLTVGDDVVIYRQVTGFREAIRAGAVEGITDTSLVRLDAELPFGAPVTYVAVVNGEAEYSAGPATYVLPGGKVAITDAVTATAAEVIILAWPDKQYDRRASVFPLPGRTVVVLGPTSGGVSTVELYVETTTARDNLVAALTLATEGTVQIRQPGGYDGVDGYYAVTGWTERRHSQDGTDERRILAVQLAEVESWSPLLEARGYTLADIAARYDVTGAVLNPNPYFETNATDWSGQGGSVARSTAQFHEGAASLLLTPGGVAATAQALSTSQVCAVGDTIHGEAWVRCSASRNINIALGWYTAASVFVSTSFATHAVVANTWTKIEVDAIAPATTGRVQLVPASLTGTPPVGHTTWIDEAVMYKAFDSLAKLANDFATLLDVALEDWS